jgi:hypothetical protein
VVNFRLTFLSAVVNEFHRAGRSEVSLKIEVGKVRRLEDEKDKEQTEQRNGKVPSGG